MGRRRVVISPRKVPAMHMEVKETDPHIASFLEGHPLADMGEMLLVEATYGDGLSIVLRLGREYRTQRAWRKLTRQDRRATLDACKWFMRTGDDGIFSFDGASHILDIDPETMRRRIFDQLKKTPEEFTAWIKQESKQIRHEECA